MFAINNGSDGASDNLNKTLGSQLPANKNFLKLNTMNRVLKPASNQPLKSNQNGDNNINNNNFNSEKRLHNINSKKTNLIERLSDSVSSESTSSSASNLSSASLNYAGSTNSSELSDIDLEIARIEKKIQIKEDLLMNEMIQNNMLMKKVSNHSKPLADDEYDKLKREFMSSSKKRTDFQEEDQDQITAWQDPANAVARIKESLTLIKPKNKKNKLFDPSNDSSFVSYRFFNDWRSHLIYYKQIKGYSHNLHLSKLAKTSHERYSSFDKGSSGELVTAPVDNTRMYSNLMVPSNEKSFYVTEAQSGFFNPKNTALSSLNNQFAVQYVHKLNNLNNILSSTQIGPNNLNNLSKLTNSSGINNFNGSNNSSMVINTNNANNKLESYISSRKINNLNFKMENVAQKIVDQMSTRSKLPNIHIGQIKGLAGGDKEAPMPNKKLKENKKSSQLSIQQQHTQQFRPQLAANTAAHSHMYLPNSYMKDEAAMDFARMNLTNTSQHDDKQQVSIFSQKENEYLMHQLKLNSQQQQQANAADVEGVDFYAKWSKLASKNNELNSLIQKANFSTIESGTPRLRISNSLVNKKFNNLINLPTRVQNKHQQDSLGATAKICKYNSDSAITLTDDSKVNMSSESDLTKKMSTHASHRSTDKLSKNMNTLSGSNLANGSSSHFPTFLNEAVKLKV